ncbi:hypothetical protein ACEWY4_017448 [Coilia grayii]|uniref:Uncharacterized protein n=1 Tax=Coilia grayii TaxID=363190 RepID=A0ABD1JGW2_9TELE
MAAALKEVLRDTLDNLTGAEFKRFKHRLRDEGQIVWRQLEKADTDDTVDLMVQVYSMGAGDIMVTILQKMNHNHLVIDLEKELRTLGCWQYSSRLSGEANRHTTGQSQGHIQLASIRSEHKEKMKGRVEYIHEAVEKTQTQASMKKIYTELYITEGKTEEVNNEHEVWQIEATARAQTTEERAISCNDIFKPLPGQSKNIRTVLTMGIAGIGKTVSVKKFILDWSEGEVNQDVGFMFMLPFRELNLVEGEKSLHELLCIFCPELKKLHDMSVYDEGKIVIIFDGLDEGKIELDFKKKIIASVTEVSTVDVLATNIIRGKLLSSSHVWITSRPAAINQIPSRFIDRVTEVRGFNDVQKEDYFHRTIDSEIHANQIVSHIKSSRTLHIMCYIPVFCWILATVLQKMLKDNVKEMPKTITEMYIRFLLIQTQMKNQKYNGGNETNKQDLLDCHKDGILKLAKLAFKHLNNRSILFNMKDLEECDIDVHDSSVYSGMFTGIFKEDSVFFEEKIYCFVHLSIQEFLAALHVFISYLNKNEEALAPFLRRKRRASPHSDVPLDELLKSAVNKALESKNGHLDLFVRFLHGISLKSNQELLLGLLTDTHSSPESVKKTIKNLKVMQRPKISPERCINLFHCLVEMHDSSVHDEIQAFLKTEKGSVKQLSLAHCSALAHVLLMSDEVLDEFDLNKYKTSPEGRRRLVPAVRCCRKALLASCKLTEKSCETVASALQSANSPLRELDLSHNDLQKSGQKLLSALQSPHCKLETLRLKHCHLSKASCDMMASVLQGTSSPLRELDMSDNDLQDEGVELLCVGLRHPQCKLQTLRLSGCQISHKGCSFLASALKSNPSYLKELELSYNHPGDSGVRELTDRLNDPKCKLETLRCDHGGECRLKPGPRKYACELTLDPNTARRVLSLSEGNRKVTRVTEEQPYPDHPDRFNSYAQVLCREGLSGRCYWEAECSGDGADIAVAYKSTQRKEWGGESRFGENDKSWRLECRGGSYSAWHNNKSTAIPAPSPRSSRVGVDLDWPAGTLSFYSVSSDTLTHLHTFHSTFTQPLYPGFWVYPDSSVSLCQIT